MKKTIRNSIANLLKVFSEYPDIFLTESDVRSYLFAILIRNNPRLLRPQKTRDDSFSIPIHSEVRWYGLFNKDRLRYRSDVVILVPEDLRVKDGLFRIPSKGFGFNSYYGIIEIKLRRINGDPDNKFLSKIKKDLIRLKEIRKRTITHNKIKKPIYYLVCLDKKNNIENDIESRIQSTLKLSDDIFLEYAFSRS